MKIFFDTEFLEHSLRGVRTIELISIGMVDEKGNTLHLISKEFNIKKAWDNSWLRDNVCKNLGKEVNNLKQFKTFINQVGLTKKELANKILEFCGPNPKFWAYFSAYDWVLFCFIFDGLMNLPDHFPQYCLDIMNVLHIFNINWNEMKKQVVNDNVHNALSDAIWVKNVWEWINNYCK